MVDLPAEKKSVSNDHWGKCFKCGEQMIQGGDHDDPFQEYGDHSIVSNFHCPACDSVAFFYCASSCVKVAPIAC